MKVWSFVAGMAVPVLVLVTLVLAGCRAVPAVENSAAVTLEEFRSISATATVEPGSTLESQSLQGFRSFLAGLTVSNVTANARVVYSPDAFFNDTLKTLRGVEAIQAYLLETARHARAIRVEFQDTTRASDGSYYVRWKMETEVDKVAGGRPVSTVGITHVRFDAQGRVRYHQDYWDSASGLFDHIPVIGRGTRFVKARL